MGHDNSDVSIAIIDLLQELTDEEAMTDSEEELEGLVDSLLAEGVSDVAASAVTDDIIGCMLCRWWLCWCRTWSAWTRK